MYYKYKYVGKADIIDEDSTLWPKSIDVIMYTTAKTEARAAQNIKWRIFNQHGIPISVIKLYPKYMKIVGGISTGKEEYPQLTLYDLFPDVMGV